MKAGPKAAVEPSSSALPPAVSRLCTVRGVLRAVHRAQGHGCAVSAAVAAVAGRAGGSVHDADPQPRTAGWMLPRVKASRLWSAPTACTAVRRW